VSERRDVLYVEDNPANYELVRRVLESTGLWTVRGITRGRDALQSLLDRRPSLVLLDLDLPDLHGTKVLQEIRKDPRLADLPVVVITASVTKHERTAAIEAGCDRFIEKPIDIARLRETVAELARP
jgi:CheY-like chemotaxis protein